MIEKVLPDGTKVTTFPITQAQHLMLALYKSYGGGPSVPVLNIGAGYYWQGDFDVELMKQALREAIDRCDTMRLRFLPDEQYGLVQFVVKDSGIEIEECDLSDISYEESYKVMQGWTKTYIDMINKPLHTIKIMHLADGYNGIYIKFQHLAMDGYSAKTFISDVMAIYLNKKTGSPYPKPMKPYMSALQKELAYLSSPKHKEDQEFWFKKYSTSTEPIYTDYMLENRLYKQRKEQNNPTMRYATMHDGNHPEADTLIFSMDGEKSAKVMQACAKNGFSVPCVLMTGLRTALSAFNENEEDVSFKFMVNRRGNLVEKKSGGVRMHFFTLRTIIGEDKTFAEAVGAVEEAEQEIFRHSDIHTLEMYKIYHDVFNVATLDQTYDCMSFSYHAPVEVPFENEEVKKTAKGVWYNNNFSMQNLYLTVKHRANDNGFDFIFEYRTAENPQRDIRVLYSKIEKAIMAGIENPSVTMGEILDEIKLTEEEKMDKIIEKILEFVELDGELTAESTLKGDCGLTSFEMVCLSQELCAELGVDESTVNLRACKTVGDLAKAFGV